MYGLCTDACRQGNTSKYMKIRQFIDGNWSKIGNFEGVELVRGSGPVKAKFTVLECTGYVHRVVVEVGGEGGSDE